MAATPIYVSIHGENLSKLKNLLCKNQNAYVIETWLCKIGAFGPLWFVPLDLFTWLLNLDFNDFVFGENDKKSQQINRATKYLCLYKDSD